MSLVKYNNNSISSLTSAGQLASGSLVPISEQTASGSASIEFTTGIDSTYPIYQFEFISIHPSNHIEFAMNGSTDGGSNYNVVKTNTTTSAFHGENGSSSAYYYIDEDLAQSTADAKISGNIYTDNDSSMSGYMLLFNPSSTTFVKHFITDTQRMDFSSVGYTNRWLTAGYMNTTSSVDAIIFKTITGTFDGTIKLYGIKDS